MSWRIGELVIENFGSRCGARAREKSMNTLLATLSLVLFVTPMAFSQQRVQPSPKARKQIIKTLNPEVTTTLHVGELAALTIRSDGRSSRSPGSTENSVILIRRSGERLIYRAFRTGRDVLVVSPNAADGECISCATVHYFIDVIPQHL